VALVPVPSALPKGCLLKICPAPLENIGRSLLGEGVMKMGKEIRKKRIQIIKEKIFEEKLANRMVNTYNVHKRGGHGGVEDV
jgi:hypothetical protein